MIHRLIIGKFNISILVILNKMTLESFFFYFSCKDTVATMTGIIFFCQLVAISFRLGRPCCGMDFLPVSINVFMCVSYNGNTW